MHGGQTLDNTPHHNKIASIPSGKTLIRIVFNWRLTAAYPAAAAAVIGTARIYSGIQTLSSAHAGGQIDPGANPVPEYNPPTERWVHWEERAMVYQGSFQGYFRSPWATYVDGGPLGEIDRHSEVIANVPGGDTLDVWLSFNSFDWSTLITTYQALWWTNVLYQLGYRIGRSFVLGLRCSLVCSDC
jgi:hypothetical protein